MDPDTNMKLFAAKVLIVVVAIGSIFLIVASQVLPGLAGWKVLLAGQLQR
jgi:hypothetical protein